MKKRAALIIKQPLNASARPDYVLLALVLGLAGFGLFMVYDASVVVAVNSFGNKYHYLQVQGVNLVIGLGALLVAARVDYNFWRKLAPLGLLVGLFLLMAVFVPGLGYEQYGARRWLDLRVTKLQPAYVLCFAMIVYLSSWLSREGADRHSWQRGLLPFSVLLGLVMLVVVVLQKDLGSGLILALTCLNLYFLSGSPLKHLGLLAPGGLAAAGLFILIEPYRMKRLFSFMDRSQDTGGSSYHINQVLIALGSGGWLGVGLGQSRQKYDYIPEVQTDSIFAILGEELGFVGSVVLVSTFCYLIWRGMRIAMRAPDMFGRLLASGIMAFVGIQLFVNLFAMAALIPLTGVPLPFISNGGTSLIVLLFSMGIVLNISKQAEAA